MSVKIKYAGTMSFTIRQPFRQTNKQVVRFRWEKAET